MTDWAMSGRRDVYRFCTVDPFTLVETGYFDAVPSDCSITYGYYTDNYSSATIVCPDTYDGGFVRVEHTVTLPDGTEESEVLGTFVVDSSERHRSIGMTVQTLTCYSTLWRLSQDYLYKDFVCKKGTSVANNVRLLCCAEGATLITMPDVDAGTHGRDARFPSASNRLESLNTLCGWRNLQLGVDDYGRQVLQNYETPSDRQVSYSFEDGANCVYLPESDETYTGDVCNRVVAKWSREKNAADNLGTCGVVKLDLPDTNPLSYESCGRRITHVLEIPEAVTPTVLEAKARSYLAQHDAAIRYFEIEHVGIPHLRAGDVVEYTGYGEEETLLCEVTQMDISALSPLMMTKSKLKVIA